MDFSEVLASLKRIEDKVIDLIKQQSEHNAILAEHKNFSIALQKEQEKIEHDLEPIKKHVYVVGNILKLAAGVAVGACVQFVVKKFL